MFTSFLHPSSPARAVRGAPPLVPWLRRGAVLLALLGGPGAAWAQCAAVTGLSVTNVTGTTAQLNFTPAAAATSYTVTYTSTGSSTVTTVSPNPTASPVALPTLLPVQNYTVTVISNCGGGQTAAAAVSFLTPVGNDEPCTATALPAGGGTCTPLNGSTSRGSLSPANGYPALGCSGQSNGTDVWYTFTTPATGPGSTGTTIAVTGNAANEVRLFSAGSCSGPFTEITCTAGPGSPPSSNNAAPPLTAVLLPGTAYYVRVFSSIGNGIPQGPFTICRTDPPACAAPNNVAVANVGATTATLSFVPGPGNTGYTLTLAPAGGGPPLVQTLGTASPYQITGLTALTGYTLTLQPTCGGAGVAVTRTFTTTHPQDEPGGAVALPVAATCQPTTGNAAGATTTAPNGYANPGCGSFTNPRDIWYTVTTPATGPGSTGVTLALTQTPGTARGADMVRVFRSAGGASGPFTEIGCTAQNFSTGAIPALVLPGLSAGTTYYVAVSSANGPTGVQGSFTICAVPAAACPQPTNLTALVQSNTAAQLSWAVPAPGGTYALEYGPNGFAPGTGAAGAVLVPGLTATTYLATGLSPNTTYQFYVTRDCGPNGASVRSGPGAFQTVALPNDEPCGAVGLPVSATCQPTAGTTVGATVTTGTTLTYIQSCSLGGVRDVWYSFTTPASGPLSQAVMVSVTGPFARYLNVFRGSSCAGPLTALNCQPYFVAGQTADPVVLSSLTPNTTYYVLVSSGNFGTSGGGPFTVCVSGVPACANPTNVRVINLTATAADLAFVPAAGSTGYSVATSPASTTAATATASPAPLTGLLPNTTYTVTLQSTCGAGQSAAITQTFTTPGLGPPNDLCANAQPIQCGQTLMGTTIGSTAVGQPTTICFGADGAGDGVFYRLIGTGDSITLSTCVQGNNTPALLVVYTGTCNSLTCFAGNSFSNCPIASTRPEVKFMSQSGVVYYALVTVGYAGLHGNFLFSMRCRQPACPVPTSVAVTVLGPTTANVSFGLGAGSNAPTYTATATPTAGGTDVTATGAASPLSLVGLLPNTVYVVTVVANCPINNPSLPSAAATFATGCPAPTAVAVAPLSPTAANVSFTPALGSSAPTYTATATPAGGGAAVTATGPASPLSLAGLRPNTAYAVTVVANCAANSASPPSAAASFTTPLTARAALAAQVGLFPNPAHHTATLTVPAVLLRQAALLTLRDALGRAVQQRFVSPVPGNPAAEARADLNLTGLPPGLYTLRLLTSEGPIVRQLLVE